MSLRQEVGVIESWASSMLLNAPVLLWSTDDALIVRDVEGADARGDVAGTAIGAWDVAASPLVRSTVVEAHRRALSGERVTFTAVWLGSSRHVTVGPIVADDGHIVGTAGAAMPAAAAGAPAVATGEAGGELAGRQLFEARVGAAIREASAAGERVAVLFLDVDRFRTVNDLGGHAAGDAVLRAIAGRIGCVIGARDAFTRFSADAFVVACTGLADVTEAVAIADAIRAAFAPPFFYGPHEFFLTVSIGISIAPDDADDAEALISSAEVALTDAKRRGRNVASRFRPAIVAPPSERHQLRGELAHAIERGQLDVFYQPVHDLASGRVAGVEALVRWRHPELGWIVPDRFIPMAEESGLIDSIGAWVIVRACEQIRDWVDAGIPDVRVSVNVSARQLERSGLLPMIGTALATSGIAPSMLEIEVTETSIVRDVLGATILLRELRAMGVRIAIDDFGAGYTSLAFLRDLPLDDLKIDRSFVHGVASGGFDGAVVRAVIMFARELGLRTIAEGVEDAAQLAALRALHCDAVQGFYCSSPLPAADCVPFLRQMIA